MKTSITTTITMALLAAVASGCSAEGDGTLDVRIWGEEFIEEGIPADVFVDGWSLSFTRFLVAIDGVGTDAPEDAGRYVFDLTAGSGGEGQGVTSLAVPSGEQTLTYQIAPGSAATGGNAAAADAMMMSSMGYSVFVDGTATKGDTTVAFAWGFDTATTYRNCEVVEDVPTDGAATTLITVHADHLFYDDLDSPEPNVAFDLIAASDADLDGTVTPEELLARDISAVARYQVGSRDVSNLWDFMAVMSQTVGHIDGEGECEI
jgi:hypothetical protein